MTEQQKLAVKGMTCTGCEDRITTALDPVPGVAEQWADHEAGTVTLWFDPAVADIQAVRDTIEGLGYRVVA